MQVIQGNLTPSLHLHEVLIVRPLWSNAPGRCEATGFPHRSRNYQSAV